MAFQKQIVTKIEKIKDHVFQFELARKYQNRHHLRSRRTGKSLSLTAMGKNLTFNDHLEKPFNDIFIKTQAPIKSVKKYQFTKCRYHL